jgi:hypothetical protein
LTCFAPLAGAIGYSASVILSALIASFPFHSLPAQSLPLGDGHVTDHPAIGSVYSCATTFRGGGARHIGPWVHGDNWNPAEKPHVAGAVLWPDAAFAFTRDGDSLRFRGNALPVKEPTGVFPIAPSDSVYQYDTNPNHIAAQHLAFAVPASPSIAPEPGCVPMGMIGFTTTGVAFYNALDAAGRDAAAHEIQDRCDGHPQGNSEYHYHNGSPCIPGVDSDSLVGWALDGFPIFGMRGSRGVEFTNADLDACHGRRERVTVDGRSYSYVYHLTREYPYTIGCFTGVVSRSTLQGLRGGLEPGRGPGGRGPGGRGPGGRGPPGRGPG